MSWNFPSPSKRLKQPLVEVKDASAFNPQPVFKLWTKGNRGVCFATLEEAQRQADRVFKKTGIVLLITEEKRKGGVS